MQLEICVWLYNLEYTASHAIQIYCMSALYFADVIYSREASDPAGVQVKLKEKSSSGFRDSNEGSFSLCLAPDPVSMVLWGIRAHSRCFCTCLLQLV